MSTVASKPSRQATACNWCRSHKMKCDAEQPSCRNCQKREVPCVTTDLRRPERGGRRTEPKGRRSNRNSITTPSSGRYSTVDHGYPSSTNQQVPRSPSATPSPTSHLLAHMEHDKAIPSIFTTPFQDRGRESSRSRVADDLNHNSTSQTSTPNLPHGSGDAMARSTERDPPNSKLLVVTDKSRSRLQIVGSGSSIYVMAHWLDLFFAKHDYWRPIYPYFQQGLAYSIEVPLSFLASLPQLPTSSQAAEYISTFFLHFYPIYPIIDRPSLERSIEILGVKLEQQPQRLAPEDYPALACLYAVFSIAADEVEGRPSKSGATYLEGAYFLYAHLVALPYVTSVQALLLLAIVLRHRNKDGASLGTLGQAIRIAQSIGLHQYMSAADVIGSGSGVDTTEVASQTDLHSRIWWTAYILERAMELETGRPSAIRDSECNQVRPRPAALHQNHATRFDYFASLIQLAQIQTQIIELFYTSKQRRETKELLHEMGRLDRALLDWAAQFPEEIRPGRDIFCAEEEYHLATYVTLQYHQTFVALHRPALMSATPWLRSRVNHLCAGTPWRGRLRYALCIGAASARAGLKALNDLLLYAKGSRLTTANQTLLLTLVLAIYVTRIPTSRMNSSDLAIVVTFAQEIEQEYLVMGQDVDFANGLGILRTQLSEHVRRTKSGPTTSHANAASSGCAAAVVAQEPNNNNNNSTCDDDDMSTDLINDFDLSSLDDVWPSLWTDDLSGLYYVNDANQDTLSAYLLGVPRMN